MSEDRQYLTGVERSYLADSETLRRMLLETMRRINEPYTVDVRQSGDSVSIVFEGGMKNGKKN